MTNLKIRKRRSDKGHVLIEFVFFAFWLLLFMYITTDVCVLLLGASANDRACRDAARAAAHGSNATEARNLAETSLKAHAGGGFFTSPPALFGNITYNDYAGNPPAKQTPFVVVETRSTAKLPFAPLVFFNNGFTQAGSYTFSRKYTFPIVRFRYAT
ncbi:MAG: hypothetical protein K2X29_12755 [Candidatus Obscuribacterales bacterium]|nr:hypothetical protein [Candidatus Obscuribacterales bacterium]